MEKPEVESLSREFAKLAGIETRAYWWCSHCLSEKSPVQVTYYEKCTYCGNHVEWVEGPDFSDAREVIRVMWKRSDWKDFVLWFANRRTPELNVFVVISDMENETGEMLELAVEWMKGKEADND